MNIIALSEINFRAILEDALIEFTRGKGASVVIDEALIEANQLSKLKNPLLYQMLKKDD